MKKTFIFLVTILFTLCAVTSCKAKNGESTVKNFINAFYTINKSDYNYYEQMKHGAKASDNKAVIKFNNKYETNTKKFKQYLSDDSYQSFYAQRFSSVRVENAYANGYFVKVKDIKVKKAGEDKKKKTIDYDYEFQRSKVNKDTNKVISTTKETGTFNVAKDNGQWRITSNIFIPRD